MATSDFPDLPLIRWETFTKRIRIRWPRGCMPVSFCGGGDSLEGTDGYWIRYEEEMKKPAKKVKKVDVKPMPDKKGGKGKGTKKDCK